MYENDKEQFPELGERYHVGIVFSHIEVAFSHTPWNSLWNFAYVPNKGFDASALMS